MGPLLNGLNALYMGVIRSPHTIPGMILQAVTTTMTAETFLDKPGLPTKQNTLRIQVCPKKGIIPTLSIHSYSKDGIGTLIPIRSGGVVRILRDNSFKPRVCCRNPCSRVARFSHPKFDNLQMEPGVKCNPF